MRFASLCLLLVVGCSKGPARLLPGEAAGYRPAGEAESYTADTLFELIDGAAEVYRSFNVEKVVSRRYQRPGADEIIVDVFDMGSPSDAFGAFRHDVRRGASAGIGRESELDGNSLAFWKDRYFVSIVAFDDSEKTQQALRAFGERIVGGIADDGDPPAIVSLLPAPGLVRSHVSYLHDWPYLSTRHSVGKDNLLGLGSDTEGLLARYDVGDGQSAILLLVQYPSADRATRGMRAFSRHRGAGKIDDKTLAFVLEAPGDAQARRLLAAVTAKEK